MNDIDLLQMAEPANAQTSAAETAHATAAAQADTAPLKVLHIISGLSQGGAETVMFRVLTASRDQVSHEVISLGELDELGPRLQAEGIPVEAFGLSGRTMLTQGRAALRAALQRIQRSEEHTSELQSRGH